MNWWRVFLAYFKWHYSQGILSLLERWRDFIWFWTKFFSLRDLLATFFLPWRRLGETYAGFNPRAWLETFLLNTMLRIVGVIIRTVIVAIWLILVIGTILAGVLALVVWLIWPLIIVLLILVGLHLIIGA